MRAAGMSERTVGNRVSLVGFFGRYAGVDACSAEWKDLAAFLGREVAPGQRISPGTRQVNYTDLDAWYSWLAAMGYRSENPVDKLHKPRSVKRYPRPITTGQLERVLDTVNRLRTRAMVLLGAYQGLRVHEIAKFRGEDIESGWLHVVGKGAKPARLPVHPEIAEIALEMPRYGYWFPSYRFPDQPVTAKSVCTVISKLMDRADVAATAHQLRHWYGTEVLRAAGGNLRIAQELLRHDSPATTALYTLVDDDEARAAIMGLPRVTAQPAIAGVVDAASVVRRLRIAA
ncbi:hypothetical protein A6V29_18540 [Blastococcus sp. CCUG 61487]|nr:hypothetical protein A6V29_18540 [Blastococcus sp. CCUG 61487]